MSNNFKEPKNYNIVDNIKNDIIQITIVYIIFFVFLIIVVIILIILFIKYYNKKENNYKDKNLILFSKNEKSVKTYNNLEKNIENKNGNKKTKLLNNQNNENNKTISNIKESNNERDCFQVNNTNYSKAQSYNSTGISPSYYIIPYFNNSNIKYIYKSSNTNNLKENTNNINMNMNTNTNRNNKVISIIPKSPKSINIIKPSAPTYNNIYNDRNNINAYNNNTKFVYYIPKSPDVTKMIATIPASTTINTYKKSTNDIKYSNIEPTLIINNSPVITDIKPSAPNILLTLKTDEKRLRNN